MKRNLIFIVLVIVSISVLLFTGRSLAHRYGQARPLSTGDLEYLLNLVGRVVTVSPRTRCMSTAFPGLSAE